MDYKKEIIQMIEKLHNESLLIFLKNIIESAIKKWQ